MTTPVPLLRDQLGHTLKRIRQQRGYTLQQLSDRAFTSTGYISELERGRKEASSETLQQLCLALDVPLSRLLRDVATFATLAENPVPDTPAELTEAQAEPAPTGAPMPMSPEWFRERATR